MWRIHVDNVIPGKSTAEKNQLQQSSKWPIRTTENRKDNVSSDIGPIVVRSVRATDERRKQRQHIARIHDRQPDVAATGKSPQTRRQRRSGVAASSLGRPAAVVTVRPSAGPGASAVPDLPVWSPDVTAGHTSDRHPPRRLSSATAGSLYDNDNDEKKTAVQVYPTLVVARARQHGQILTQIKLPRTDAQIQSWASAEKFNNYRLAGRESAKRTEKACKQRVTSSVTSNVRH